MTISDVGARDPRTRIPTPLEQLGKFLDCGAVSVVDHILKVNNRWFQDNADISSSRLLEVQQKLEEWRNIDRIHGDGSAINLEHAIFMKQFDQPDRNTALWASHLENARKYRNSIRSSDTAS